MACPRNDKEIKALAVMVVNDLGLEVGILMRYLRAGNLDIGQAEKNLRNCIKWKQRSDIYNNLVKKNWKWKPPPEMLLKLKFIYISGVDSEQRLVLYLKLEESLPLGPVLDNFEPVNLHMFSYSVLTFIHELIKSTKHQQLVLLVDCVNVGFRQVYHEVYNWTGIRILRDGIHMIEQAFPETIHSVFLINSARAAVWGFNFIKPFLTENTANKIQIYGSNKAVWVSKIGSCLPVEVIPQELGGVASKLTPLYDILFRGDDFIE